MLSILHTSVIQITKLFPVTGGMLNRDHILFSEALFRFAPAVMKADLIDMCFHASVSRPPNKSTSIKIHFLISQPKHMLWVLKRTVSMRRFV